MKWIKPSGLEIVTNDDQVTEDYCLSLGWKKAEAKVVSPVTSVGFGDGGDVKKREPLVKQIMSTVKKKTKLKRKG